MATASSSSTNLPDFQSFDVNSEPTSLGLLWTKWTQRLENLFIALDIEDRKRQRALLLYYGGSDVHNIYRTLTAPDQQDEEYEAAKRRLTAYFEPKINETFEVYSFRQIKQYENETIDKYVSRLREVAQRCNSHNIDCEIKDQIVFTCLSDKLRRKALKI